MAIINTRDGQRPTALFSDDDLQTSQIPVDLSSDTAQTLMRVVVPVKAGDVLDIKAYARFTNDCGYTIGVGYHLWWYDVDDGIPWPHKWPWTRIATCGDNVPPARHHIPVHITAPYRVPDDWPEGHRMVVVFRADAHSTAWKSDDTLTVDSYGNLTVVRWTEPAA